MVEGVATARLAGRAHAAAGVLRWLDRNVERVFMIPLYAFIALLIGGEGILRYLTGEQTQWGGSAAIQAFIFLSWVGCAYHVRHRSHLRFDAVRARLPGSLRRAAYMLDAALWVGIAAIVVYHSSQLAAMHESYGSTLEGTDSVPLWVVTATVPAAWLLIAIRAIQDLVLLLRKAR